MNKKSNKRYQKNKQRIQTTLISLLQEKELSKITVQEICETLDINRSTFYYHYMDIFDLAEQVFKETNRRLLERMKKEFHLIPFSEKSAILFFEYIKENKEIYKASNLMRIEFPFDEGKSQMVEMFTARHHQSLSDDAVMYEIIFFQAGLTFVLRKWLDHDCSDPIVSLIQPLKMYLK